MNWQKLLAPDIQNFIREHENADIAALALKKCPDPAWEYRAVLDQIKSRQKAAIKTPEWLGIENIIFPPPNVMEQASSMATALYKASLINGQNFTDLTGGSGMDAAAFAQSFKRGTVIDLDPDNAELLKHNLDLLSNNITEVHNANAENFIKTMPETNFIFIDPMRRDNGRKGRYRLEDCKPNVLEMMPALLKKAKTIMIKTSPMLDIAEGIKALGNVSNVHIIEHKGDCKELLFILSTETNTDPKIHAATIDEKGQALKSLTFTLEEEISAETTFGAPLKYIYEPGPAFQKSGGFKTISNTYKVEKLAPHTHLYTSDTLQIDFPGRIFENIGLYPVQAGKTPLKKANLTVRNFPMSVADLRKKLKLAEGGEDTLFACTLKNGNKTLIHCKKP